MRRLAGTKKKIVSPTLETRDLATEAKVYTPLLPSTMHYGWWWHIHIQWGVAHFMVGVGWMCHGGVGWHISRGG